MLHPGTSILDEPFAAHPDPDDFIRAAMEWHFSPQTGSRFWLERARTLDFDPRSDVRSFRDLVLFPNVANELRDVPVRDLIPQGYGAHADIVGVYESGGTTGPPKRIVMLRDFWDAFIAQQTVHNEARGVPHGRDWLALFPSGPHMVGEMIRAQATAFGGVRLAIDMDPRWVKKLIAARRADEAEAYADHLIDQAAFVLRTQDVGVLMATPPMLERLAGHDDLVELVQRKVAAIQWGGAHMDADTRYLLRTEVFGGVSLYGGYGSTMVLGGAPERLGLGDGDACIFDPMSPCISFSVVNPETRLEVEYGERGQVVMNHISKSFLLPNNLERDIATRIVPPEGQMGDSVADIAPVREFDGEAVIEGVY